ncbi:MAG TPA: hypothetical protein VMZ24_02510 [Patescibacteria group bacterium]|nr:hypothetical protein [Patescibacteria group bacterium]
MTKFKSIICPEKKDHKYPKFLLFVGKNEIYAYCQAHFWIKIIFKRGNSMINFENTAVIAEPMGEHFHFDHEEMPLLALGKFNLKRKTEEKRYGKCK